MKLNYNLSNYASGEVQPISVGCFFGDFLLPASPRVTEIKPAPQVLINPVPKVFDYSCSAGFD